MSRRTVSPIRFKSDGDPRDNIIRKLKEDIIVAKGRQKEQDLLGSYLLEVIERGRLTMAETAKVDEEGKIQLQITLKSLNDHKKQADILRAQLKKLGNSYREAEDESNQLKRIFTSRHLQIDNLTKQASVLESQNQKLIVELVRLKTQQQDGNFQIANSKQKGKIYELRIIQVGAKLQQVRSFIADLQQQAALIRQKLRNYETQNSILGQQIDQKDSQIDLFQQQFSQQHQVIKKLVQNYIDLQNQQERVIKETQHNLVLIRSEAEKNTDLSAKLKKVEKNITDRRRQFQQVRNQSKDIVIANQDLREANNRTKTDIMAASAHLQNIFKNNAFLREEMEEMLRQDEVIIAILRKKRLISIKP